MFDFDLSQAQLEETALAAAITVGGFVLAWFVSRLSRIVIHAFTRTTDTEIDDILANALRGPVVWFIALQGLFIGLKTLSYLDQYADTIQRTWVALALMIVVIAARRVVLELVDWLATRPGVSELPGFDARSMPFVRRLLNVLVLSVGALLVMDALGISISPLLAGLGLGGFAVALALQPLLSNIFASSYVITDASIAVGDYVEVDGGPTGVVEDIGWRATRIRTFDNNISMVPNASVADSIITNYDSADARADARVDCGIAYEEDLDSVEEIVLDEINKLLELDYVDKARTPIFRYSEFADSNVNFFVKMRAVTWGDSFMLKHQLMKCIHRRLTAEGIVINYPARRLMLASEDVEGFERLGSALRNGDSIS
jgi:small-conductance mechanosensitive channel